MDIHENARTTPHSRAEIVRRVLEEGWSRKAAAEAFGVCIKTVGKWIDRFLAEGLDGLKDRSSRPHRLRNPTPEAKAGDVIALRRQRLPGDEIARLCGLSPATVSRILRAAKLSRARDLDPPPPIRRYEHPNPGDMIHIDIKARTLRAHRTPHNRRPHPPVLTPRTKAGLWLGVRPHLHDDASRLSFTQIHPDEKATSAVAHLKASVAWYQSLGVSVRRVMTDNGSCYNAFAFRDACRELGLKHIRTKPYTPRTNGKAERFIQTSLREWAYAKAYDTSDQRAADLPVWTHRYNWHRPHGGIKSQTPISRLGLTEDNLLRVHI